MTKKSPDTSYREPMNSEFGLVCSLTEFLSNSGYRVRLEVSNMGQSIDLVATKGKYISAIEAKRSNWRRALSQCRAHRLVADYIAIAIPAKKAPNDLIDILESEGWGLLLYNADSDSWAWEKTPKRNPHIWKPQRAKFLSDLKAVAYVS